MARRSTIIFGNGLGRTLDNDYFRLEPAMEAAWKQPDLLTNEQRELIKNCLKAKGIDEAPSGEEDLYYLHSAANACEILDDLANHGDAWLTELGKDFPLVTRGFLTTVAWHFHNPNYVLPKTFLEPLFGFVGDTNSHIATLNYDNLLYQPMIEAGLLAGYDGNLVDGFHVYQGGFAPANMKRQMDHNFGYYLHLHGSPLFIGGDLHIQKQLQGNAQNIPTKHLVLSHFEHKPSIIYASPLLRTYWSYLNLALQESVKIYIVGYSGLDEHLNQTIEAQALGKIVYIIERSGEGPEEDRQAYWQTKIPTANSVEMVQLENILDFTEWNVE